MPPRHRALPALALAPPPSIPHPLPVALWGAGRTAEWAAESPAAERPGPLWDLQLPLLAGAGPSQREGRGRGTEAVTRESRPPPPASPGALGPELPPLGSRRCPFMEGRTPCTPARKPRGGGSQRGGGLGGRVSEKRRWGAPGRPRGGRLPASPCPPSRPQPEHVSPRAPGPPMASAPPTGESKVLSARPAAQAPLQGLQPPQPAVHGDAEPRLGDAAVTGL